MEKKALVFYIFNILKPGGTSRSAINMITNGLSLDSFDKYYILNYQNYSKKKVRKFLKENNFDDDKVKFISMKELKKLEEEIYFIITREDFFSITEKIKDYPNIKNIIGEVHAPLKYIEDKYLFLENIDVIKVNTEFILKEFKKKYNYENVIYNYVSLDHLLNIKPKKIKIDKNNINLYIISRLDEEQKNISYAIKFINYLKQKNEKVRLFIDGYGPDEDLYDTMIRELSLEEMIFINHKEKPEDLIPVSFAKYETFGFSIIEGIQEYGSCLLFPGLDENLKEIYEESNRVKYLTLNLKEDYKIFKSFVENYSEKDEKYIEDIFNKLNSKNYLNEYKEKVKNTLSKKNKYDLKSQDQEYLNLKRNTLLKSKNELFKNKLKKITPHKFIPQKIKIKLIEVLNKKVKNDLINENNYFIETFHGKNFSGNPKALAFEIRKENLNANIYVSSINKMVDIEIISLGFTPIRFNSFDYKEKYKKSKYIISNGNVLLGLPKIEGQVHIQTWHGLSLKNMVYDLNDKKERDRQVEAFLPRMKKWDYLLTSGGEYTKLLSSAFNLKENNHVKIIEKGMPRVNFIKTVDVEYIKDKYGIDSEKKVILFSPTWRKEKRKSITELNLLKMVEHFEDYVIILKLHPLEVYIRDEYKDLHPRIIVPLIEFSDINELYAISDILISDYSSVIFDYMHLGRPIIVNQEDEENYGNNVGFYFDIEQETGLKTNKFNTEEMIKEVESKVDKVYDYSNFIKKYTPKDITYKEGDILKYIK